MALITETANFRYESQHDPVFNPADVTASLDRGRALAATCEADLRTLQGWFDEHAGFGPSNKVTIVIGNLAQLRAAPALGMNSGYRPDGATRILTLPFTFTPNADAAARAVFVAEMAEVMMDRRNQATGKITWLANNSMGEALSTVCEALLHPEGYYGANLGPRIATWLNVQVRT